MNRGRGSGGSGKGGKGKGKWGQNSWQPDEFWHPQHPRAVPFTETYHISTLRAYPGEQGEVFVKRQGAKKTWTWFPWRHSSAAACWEL